MPQHKLIHFDPKHFAQLDLGGSLPSTSVAEIAQLTDAGEAWTIMLDGFPVACGGYLVVDEGVAHLWSEMNSTIGGIGMLFATRRTRLLMEQLYEIGMTRLEMAVKTSFPAGHRWARMLGFACESMKQNYYEGEDYSIYSRIED